MRIIAGKYRGKVLAEFKGSDIRPTADRAKEALFNILQLKTPDSEFLDLYAGTGSIGIEALSRGAKCVKFVDNSKSSVDLIKKNLSSIKETAEVVFSDALTYANTTSDKFDIIFLDPPYAQDACDLLNAIAENKLLKDDGVLIYEHTKGEKSEPKGLKKSDTRIYGIAVFDFYRYEE